MPRQTEFHRKIEYFSLWNPILNCEAAQLRNAAYGQRNPAEEFKFQSFDIFEQMINSIKSDTVSGLLSLVVKREEDLQREELAKDATASHGGENVTKKTVVNKDKVGRNDPCPCGSGKKYKKCCGIDK